MPEVLREVLPEAAGEVKEEGGPPVRGGSDRRRRYVRTPPDKPLAALTPTKVQLLCFLAQCRFLSLPQLARLCCPSEKSARRHMRELFDAGLVDVMPVSRLALAPPDAPNDASLLYGSAPNLYVPTPRGLELLLHAGLIGKETVKRTAASYGPKNSLFLAHELAVRDVRVWLEGATQAAHGEQQVLAWKDGNEAVLDLGHGGSVRPDAWFVHRIGQTENRPSVLVGLVEVDRGTERGDKRWQEKLGAYEELFSGGALKVATGYVNARILVITPDARRRDGLATFIGERSGTMAPRFWFAERVVLQHPSLAAPYWWQSGDRHARALVGF